MKKRRLKRWVKVLVTMIIIEALLVISLLDLGIVSIASLMLMTVAATKGIGWIYER